MPNEEIFNKYYIQLRLRVQNGHNYQSYLYLLETFREFLSDRKPSPDLAREFVAGYHDQSRNTQANYDLSFWIKDKEFRIDVKTSTLKDELSCSRFYWG